MVVTKNLIDYNDDYTQINEAFCVTWKLVCDNALPRTVNSISFFNRPVYIM